MSVIRGNKGEVRVSDKGNKTRGRARRRRRKRRRQGKRGKRQAGSQAWRTREEGRERQTCLGDRAGVKKTKEEEEEEEKRQTERAGQGRDRACLWPRVCGTVMACKASGDLHTS